MPPWEVQECVNEQGTLSLFLICFLILPAKSAAWTGCVAGIHLSFPCPPGRIRSNETVTQYLCLLGLFWPGAFHLTRTSCIRNKGFFPATLPLCIASNPSPWWIFEISETVLLSSSWSCEHSRLGMPVQTLQSLWWTDVLLMHPVCFMASFCALISEGFSALQKVCLCNQECVKVGSESVSLIYYLFIFTHFLNPSPEPQGIISLI